MAWLAVGALAFCALIAIGGGVWWWHSEHRQQGKDSAGGMDGKVAEFGAAPDSRSQGKQETQALSMADEPAPHLGSGLNDSSQESDPDRSMALQERFLEKYAAYDQQIPTRLDRIDLKKWRPNADQEIASMHDDAFRAFGSKRYPEALQILQALHSKAVALIRDADAEFAQRLADAEAAFEAGDRRAAEYSIEAALMLDRDAEDAQSLQVRIDLLPQILPLLKRAEVARIENNPEKELQALVEALKIDPARGALAQRRDALSGQVRSASYEALIRQANASLGRGDARKAQSLLSKAEGIIKGKADAALLRQRIDALDKQRRIGSLRASIEKARSADDWDALFALYGNLLKLSPGDADAQYGIDLAKSIRRHIREMSGFIEDPWSMTGGNRLKLAASQLQLAREGARHSSKLQDLTKQVAALQKKMEREISVSIASDNATHIQVRGVGKVGKVTQKTIRLKPGKYVLEGRREGYKSKLLDVTVPYDKDQISLEFACNERI